MTTIVRANDRNLGSLFSKAIFEIPRFQRSYSWDENNWQELWDDIIRNVIDEDRDHFLGAIIYFPQNKIAGRLTHFNVIDGQQRLITLTILMRVLFEVLNDHSSPEYRKLSNELYEKYLGNDEGIFFLKLSKKDDAFYNDYIQRRVPVRIRKGKIVSNKALRKCYEFFKLKLAEECNKRTVDPADFSWDLKKKMEENIVFAVLEVNSDVDGYNIFESINAKRQNLTVSDLLKNYFLSAADQMQKISPDTHVLSDTESKWEKIEQVLEPIDLTQYVRHFWISSHGKVYEKELYQTIKRNYGYNNAAIIQLLDRLFQEVETYVSIVTGNLDTLSSEGNRALMQLKQLRNRQFYPVVLSAVASGSPAQDISNFLVQFASVAARRAVIGRNPNELEIFFAENAERLRSDISLSTVTRSLSENYWISDSDVENELRTASFEDQEILAKFILREFESHIHPAGEKEIKKISLEHVLPRSPEALTEWPFSPEEHTNYLWNIGNLALIGPDYNNRMSNQAFVKKCPFLAKSEIATTKKISVLKDWDIKAIEHRNFEIVDFFKKWWPKVV